MVDSTTFVDAQAGASCAQWRGTCSKQNVWHHALNQESYIDDCSLFQPNLWAFADASHTCEVGGYVGGGGQYYTKATMDSVRANCPVACYTCHDDDSSGDASSAGNDDDGGNDDDDSVSSDSDATLSDANAKDDSDSVDSTPTPSPTDPGPVDPGR